MIDLTIHPEGLAHNVLRAREKGIVIPTFAQMRDPSKVPEEVLGKLKRTGLWDVDPVNLFRITWKNEPTDRGGLFGKPNYIELPTRLTGVPARIVALVGKWFPRAATRWARRLAAWCRALLRGSLTPRGKRLSGLRRATIAAAARSTPSCWTSNAIAILPEGMSRERFDWLRTIVGEIIATPGCESNVKEIFDKSNELKKARRMRHLQPV